MEISFEPRAKAWRGRGRPPRQPSANALKSCEYTAQTGTVAMVPLSDDPAARKAEVRDLKADMRAAERVLGGKVHHQVTANRFNFYWVPAPRKPG